MVLWAPGLSVKEAYNTGTLAAEAVTKVLQSGHLLGLGTGSLDRTSVKLANEKVECPYLLIGKKMYAAIKWVPGKTDFVSELEFKGIDAVRRDRTKVVRDLSEAILNALMMKADAKLALSLLNDGLRGILDNTIPLEDYIMSKSLKGSYSSENLPHVAAWKRMKERGDAGLPPQGSRMPFIITMPKGKKVPLYEIAEHPAFVKTNKTRPWPEYYIEQVRSAIERILEPTGIPVKSVFDSAEDEAKFIRNGTASLKKGKRSLEGAVVTDLVLSQPVKKKATVSLKQFA
jgi:DNA polymerase elongation subunit (family B)